MSEQTAEEAVAEKFIEMVPEWMSDLITKVEGRYLPGYIHVPEGLVEYVDGEKLKMAISPVCDAHPDLEIIYWRSAAVVGVSVGGISLGGVISWKQRDPDVIAMEEFERGRKNRKLEENERKLSEDESEGRTT